MKIPITLINSFIIAFKLANSENFSWNIVDAKNKQALCKKDTCTIPVGQNIKITGSLEFKGNAMKNPKIHIYDSKPLLLRAKDSYFYICAVNAKALVISQKECYYNLNAGSYTFEIITIDTASLPQNVNGSGCDMTLDVGGSVRPRNQVSVIRPNTT